jgi:hypothetical protein
MRPVEMMARVELLLQSGGFSLGQLSNCLEGRRGLVLEIVKDVGHIPLEVVQSAVLTSCRSGWWRT